MPQASYDNVNYRNHGEGSGGVYQASRRSSTNTRITTCNTETDSHNKYSTAGVEVAHGRQAASVDIRGLVTYTDAIMHSTEGRLNIQQDQHPNTGFGT